MVDYLSAIAVTGAIYALMALGMNLTWGLAGMVNLGLIGFFAVGAYTSALLTLKFGLPIGVGVVSGAIVAAATGAGVALITARLRGDYLAIVTLGFAEAIRITAANEIWLTNGSDGLSGIPGPWRSALDTEMYNLVFLGIIVAVVAVAYVVTERLARAPFGRVLRAIRDDEQIAAVAGKTVIVFKVQAFALSSAALGVAGALYAHYNSYIAPEIFVPLFTLYIILALLAGGRGNNRGAILGGFLVVFLLEGTRFAIPYVPALSAVQGAALRELLIAAVLLVILRLRPAGILREPRLEASIPRAGAETMPAP